MNGRAWLALVAALVFAATTPAAARAQAPDARWRTLRTEHFRVHFTPELEELARRTAANAERAYAQLAAELQRPRGVIELVVADDMDFANGYATTFPSNRIVVFAAPPVDSPTLRFYDEWNTLLVTHELAHVFHLDRTRGWWRLAQGIFGRSPLLFPNHYLPAWITEGIAVYYETRLTGSGRIAGTQHRALARAAAGADALPGLGDLSLATPRFPGGEVSYAYGGLFLDHLARTRGEERVGRFIESVARAPIPLLLDRRAQSAFGVSFRRAWDEWRDSVAAAESDDGGVAAAFEPRTPPFWSAQAPRWIDGDALLFGGNPGNEVSGVYTLDGARGARRRARRNDASVNVPLADGGVVYAQPDFVDPYRLRYDLYVQHGARERRLTYGARLASPDARTDGAIVAVQTLPGATRLVRVSADGAIVAPLTDGTLDVHWAEPRWSPEGARLVAVRWRVGGESDVVVLDTLGRDIEVVVRARAVQSAPAWMPDGAAIVYASDSSGRSEIYSVALRGTGSDPAAARPRRLGAAMAGHFQPSPSPDGARVAAVRYDAAGWRIAVADTASALREGTLERPRDGRTALAAIPTLPLLAPDASPSRPYNPWPQLVPRYWLPAMQEGEHAEWLVGPATSGRDVVGRHAYRAEALIGTATGLVTFDGAWRYAGLGQPLIDIGVGQRWRRFAIPAQLGGGELRRRAQSVALFGTLVRPRVRASSWLSAGGEMEWRDYRTDPEPVLANLDPFFSRRTSNPVAQLSMGFSNARRPLLSISPEDGVTMSVTGRQRWLSDDVAPQTRNAIGVAAAYRSLPFLPGFAHHVLAARVAGGWADDAAVTEFEVGGVSGGTLEVIPGIVVGEGPRAFGVRGVAPGTQWGTRASSATVEYRAPLAVPGRGLWPLPLFVDRASLAAFGEVGTAWCPASAADRPVCRGALAEPRWVTSVGGELALDASFQYDIVYRFRLGVAVPRADAAAGVASGGARLYLAVGRAF